MQLQTTKKLDVYEQRNRRISCEIDNKLKEFGNMNMRKVDRANKKIQCDFIFNKTYKKMETQCTLIESNALHEITKLS